LPQETEVGRRSVNVRDSTALKMVFGKTKAQLIYASAHPN